MTINLTFEKQLQLAAAANRKKTGKTVEKTHEEQDGKRTSRGKKKKNVDLRRPQVESKIKLFRNKKKLHVAKRKSEPFVTLFRFLLSENRKFRLAAAASQKSGLKIKPKHKRFLFEEKILENFVLRRLQLKKRKMHTQKKIDPRILVENKPNSKGTCPSVCNNSNTNRKSAPDRKKSRQTALQLTIDALDTPVY